MRNTMRKIAAALAAGALIFSAGAFAKDGHIKVGVITGPEFQIAETVKQIAVKHLLPKCRDYIESMLLLLSCFSRVRLCVTP